MENLKVINKENLYHNLSQFSGRKICAMVKSNAYGHGLLEIASLIKDRVSCFGVVNIAEALTIRKVTDLPILICSKVNDFKICKENNIDVMIDDERDLTNCLESGLTEGINLKVNCGMNRFGVNSVLLMRTLNDVFESERINLKSIYTHFPCTENKKLTYKHMQNFQKLRAEISQNAPICFGGSGIASYPFEYDILRLGIGMYGYGAKNLQPILSIQSYVSKVFFATRGQNIGYGNAFSVHHGGFFAVVPVGYGDGLRRNLSGKISVIINNTRCKIVGNICMDSFFVAVDENVKVGDKVVVMDDADYFAEKIGTIPYEILTGLANFRGKTEII